MLGTLNKEVDAASCLVPLPYLPQFMCWQSLVAGPREPKWLARVGKNLVGLSSRRGESNGQSFQTRPKYPRDRESKRPC
jgi:hypothetical protein